PGFGPRALFMSGISGSRGARACEHTAQRGRAASTHRLLLHALHVCGCRAIEWVVLITNEHPEMVADVAGCVLQSVDGLWSRVDVVELLRLRHVALRRLQNRLPVRTAAAERSRALPHAHLDRMPLMMPTRATVDEFLAAPCATCLGWKPCAVGSISC